jgi:hypothetical protein
LNPHDLRHWILSPACLPIPALPRAFKTALINDLFKYKQVLLSNILYHFGRAVSIFLRPVNRILAITVQHLIIGLSLIADQNLVESRSFDSINAFQNNVLEFIHFHPAKTAFIVIPAREIGD